MHDTICALSTPSGTGAIAVIRLSGPEAFVCIRRCCAAMDELGDRKAMLVELIDDEGPIDEALITCFHGPRSYTGEDVVEIGVHGSPYIQQRVLNALTAHGARSARPGEFTLRAFLNKKLDLAQAEAVADLIASSSAAAHRLAMHQLRGGYSERIELLRQQLIDMSALVELELDFGEEDVEFADRSTLQRLLHELRGTCTRLVGSFKLGNAVKHGIPVAIIGAPNSGKSTLLNALLEEDRAIVSEVPGTTRDTVEDTMSLGGVLFRFIDTAGLRDTTDHVEKLGIERSYRKASEARVVLFLGDASTVSEQALATGSALLQERLGDGPEVIPILSKMDLATRASEKVLSISARTGQGLDALRALLLERTGMNALDQADVVVTNARHVEALTAANDALRDAQQGIDDAVSGELLATDLRRAQHHLGEITGKITPEDLLGSIFGRFCIGK